MLNGLLFLTLPSCIERFNPETELDFDSRLVVDATIIPDESNQEIIISRLSALDNPEFIPGSGYQVSVEDDNGHSFSFQESEKPGHYRGTIDGSAVIIGAKYRLSIITPENKTYVSRFEELFPCPPVDSLYSEFESKPTSRMNENEAGLQFFVDFKADQTYGHFFRWSIEETYEYHSSFPLNRWRDDNMVYHDLAVPDYSSFICYKTSNLDDIFVLSTEGFSSNSYKRYKLHFVNNLTQRLQHRYSIQVRQLSLTQDAWQYWEILRKNNQETVNLFGKQPASLKGNIYNVSDSTDLALGYFSVSSLSARRITIRSVPEMSFDRVFYCKPIPIDAPLPPDGALYFAWTEWKGVRTLGLINEDCIFCPLLGGTTEKPVYWDQITN
ncbi:MAG: DUF4249 domain-containing protein [Prolixibacteraceae bacterium]